MKFLSQKNLPLLISAALSFALALFFRFALIGYGTLALLLFCLAAMFFLYLLLPGKLKVMLTVLVCLAAAVLLAALVPVIRESGGDAADADYVIVLGAGVNGDVPSLSLADRLRAAEAYLQAHPDAVAILSGGQGEGENVTEAEAMYRWLTARGVSETRLIKEERATSTLENIACSYALIPDADSAAVAVLSGEYHLCRAKYLASSLGYTVSGVPAETSLPVLKLNYFLREALALIYYQIFGVR